MARLVDPTATALVNGSTDTAQKIKGFTLAIKLNADSLGNQTTSSFRTIASFVKRGRAVSVVRTLVFGNDDTWIFIQTFSGSP